MVPVMERMGFGMNSGSLTCIESMVDISCLLTCWVCVSLGLIKLKA